MVQTGQSRTNYNKDYYEKNKDRIKLVVKKWREDNLDIVRERLKGYKRKHRYGLSVEEFENLKSKQNSMCAICDKHKKLVVDHDHKTNKVRGLLCQSCNKGLGHFFEDINSLNNAVNYLRSVTH